MTITISYCTNCIGHLNIIKINSLFEFDINKVLKLESLFVYLNPLHSNTIFPGIVPAVNTLW
jgi:hypothetical protein